MNSSTTLVILMTLIALGAAVLLLGTPQTEAPAATTTPSPVTTISQPTTGSSAPETPPTVDAGPNLTLSEGERVQLHGQGSSAGGGTLHYRWSVASGQGTFSDPNRLDPVYTAPTICGCEACIPVTLTIMTDQGASATDQLTVRVHGDAVACRSAPRRSPCGATSPCPPQPPITVSRCQPQPLACESPCVPLITPTPPCPRAPVPCCSCPCGSAMLFFWPPEERSAAPGDHATPLIDRHYPAWIDEGTTVRLQGTVNNPACTTVCFAWTASKGTFENADTLTPIYHAPSSDRLGGESVTITLTVRDGFGGSAYDQVRLKIANKDYFGATPTQPENAWLLGQR